MPTSLQTVRLRKEYPGTVALDDVSVRFDGGSVHALLGKNGAGKSTLVKILGGTVQPTSGEIVINDRVVKLNNARDAFGFGIATVHQELSLIPELTVAENVLLGRMPRKAGWGGMVIDWPAARRRASEILAQMGLNLDVRQKVRRLGVAQQQVVEIAKAMSFSPAALMLDEPTSALAKHEAEMLFGIVRRLAASGVAIIYITHRLQELAQVADTVTVLRDGRNVGTVKMRDVEPEQIVRMIFGSVMPGKRTEASNAGNETVLDVRGLSSRGKFHDVNLTVRRGEIVGIAGMLGSGRTELLRAIFGADKFDAGEVELDGKILRQASIARMKRLGAALIPENRKEQALILGLSVRENLCLASLKSLAHCGVLTGRREGQAAAGLVRQLDIKVGHPRDKIDSLSGGNQQKVVVGKWLNTHPSVMLFDEPTRGIDLQAKQQIFQIIWDLSRRGIASLFVSSELEELLEVCDRIMIMRDGRLVEEVSPSSITVEELAVRCMSQTHGSQNRSVA